MRLTRRYRFSASHRLHTAALSEAENREVYGKCNNPFGHGHNYVLEVSVRGPVERVSGAVLDCAGLDALIEREVLGPFAHADLNAAMTTVPTTENLAVEIRDRLRRSWPETWPAFEKVRLHETRRNIFEIHENE